MKILYAPKEYFLEITMSLTTLCHYSDYCYYTIVSQLHHLHLTGKLKLLYTQNIFFGYVQHMPSTIAGQVVHKMFNRNQRIEPRSNEVISPSSIQLGDGT